MKHQKHFHRLLALLMCCAMLLGTIPMTASASQSSDYHDPVDTWVRASGRTNEYNVNAVVLENTTYCRVCKMDTVFRSWRVPEYTKDGETALKRNIKYSDGTLLGGVGSGTILDGTPGVDAFYTGYHWTKSACTICGTLNSNMEITDYAFGKNVFFVYDCDSAFFTELPETVTYEAVDDSYHTKTTHGGEYCGFCFGTHHHDSSTLEQHKLDRTITPEIGHQRFKIVDSCADCGYEKTQYVTAKAVIADYYGVVDGQPHTITVTDLCEGGVTTAIRYGNSADSCTLTSAPNFTEEGQNVVYYEITYSYQGKPMVQNGVAYVWLRDENPALPTCSGSSGDGTHRFAYLDRIPASCQTLGYDRYVCADCGTVEKRNYTAAVGHVWQGVLVREATCEQDGKLLEICQRCGQTRVTDTPKSEHQYSTRTVQPTCTNPGYTIKECSVCGDRHITNIIPAKGHSYSATIIPPNCTNKGYTNYFCFDCGAWYKGDYTDPTGHKAGDWIVDVEPTTDSEGSRHRECEDCGEVLDTEPMEQLYRVATTDTHGEAVVGGYLVIVTDTDTANPVANAAVVLNQDDTISIRLPGARILDYGDQTTVTVLLNKDKSSVSGKAVNVTDKYGNYSAEKTDNRGKITVPSSFGVTGEDGKTTFGGKDQDGKPFTYTVRVISEVNGRTIPSAIITWKNGKLLVRLPDGFDLDEKNRIIVTVLDNRQNPKPEIIVIARDDREVSAEDRTDEGGTATLPEILMAENHAAYIVGYPNGNFGPTNSMTRAEAAAIFARLLAEKNGDTLARNGVTKFSDVPVNAWYAGSVRYLSAYNVVYGVGGGRFAPDKAVSRAEFTAMAVRFFEAYGKDAPLSSITATFSDVSSKSWALDAIISAAGRGWIVGYKDGTFRPNQEITRAEAVTIVNKALNRNADRDYVAVNLKKLVTFPDVSEKHWAYYAVLEAANGHKAVYDAGETWAK